MKGDLMERIQFKDAIWNGYMDQQERCENCGQVLDKRKDDLVEFIYYEGGTIKEELFFCCPMHLTFWAIETGLIPSDIDLIVKPIKKEAEKKLATKNP